MSDNVFWRFDSELIFVLYDWSTVTFLSKCVLSQGFPTAAQDIKSIIRSAVQTVTPMT